MDQESGSEATIGSTESSSTGGATVDAPFVASDETPIWLTPAAVTAVKKALEEEGQENENLRVSIHGGGCAGFEYDLDFDKDERAGDIVLEFEGFSVFVDPISAQHLKGTVIDYISGLQGTGFKFNNPNAKRGCGCGKSFS